MRILIAGILIFIPLSALSNQTTIDCEIAMEAGDDDKVKDLAKKILYATGASLTKSEQEMAKLCILSGTGQAYEYVPRTGGFINKSVLERSKEVEAKKEEDKRRQEQAEAEQKARRLEAEGILAKQKQERETTVYNRLIDGCETMYKRDPDQTITNKLCLDVFLELGLPD